MRVGAQHFFKPESSFLSVDKDMAMVAEKLLTNDRLLKMLYYTQPDCLKAKDLTPAQKLSLINKQIKIVPEIKINTECPIYVLICFDNWSPNALNPQFRDCHLRFHILCHPDHWNMNNFQLRPYKIAGEIDAMINNQKLTGIGTAQFYDGYNITLNSQNIGLTLVYECIHGVEDVIDPLVDE